MPESFHPFPSKGILTPPAFSPSPRRIKNSTGFMGDIRFSVSNTLEVSISVRRCMFAIALPPARAEVRQPTPDIWPDQSLRPTCACRKSNSDIMVIQSTQDRTAKNVSRQFDGRGGRVFVFRLFVSWGVL